MNVNTTADLNLDPLKKALASLEDILNQKPTKYIIPGVIQNFEITFELSWKAMQRLLKVRGVSSGSPHQVIRAAFKESFIEDLEMWLSFLKKRNLTVHTYNEDTAHEVYQSAQIFPSAVHALINRLEKEISS